MTCRMLVYHCSNASDLDIATLNSPDLAGGGDNGGLCFDEEKTSDPYCAAGQGGSSCAPGQTYHGRGPIQLSW